MGQHDSNSDWVHEISLLVPESEHACLGVCVAMLLAQNPPLVPTAVFLADLPHWQGAAHGRWEDGQKQCVHQL